ncbi:unnamed protein product [Malus baccata var. baccata]
MVDILTGTVNIYRCHSRISSIQPLKSKQINQRIAYKCGVRIENIRKEALMVTLWADVGEYFSSLSTNAFSLPVVVIFTSLKVKLYLDKIVLNRTGSSFFFTDPDIPEVNAYKSVFSNCKKPLKVLPPLQNKQMKLQFCKLLEGLQFGVFGFGVAQGIKISRFKFNIFNRTNYVVMTVTNVLKKHIIGRHFSVQNIY